MSPEDADSRAHMHQVPNEVLLSSKGAIQFADFHGFLLDRPAGACMFLLMVLFLPSEVKNQTDWVCQRFRIGRLPPQEWV
jgi:hypothetical protein